MAVCNSSKEEIFTLSIKQEHFKKCTNCGKSWLDRNRLLSDPELVVVGYQVHFKDLDKGLFLFNHICGTSLAITTGEFRDLYDGPFLTESKFGTEECPDYCLRKEDLSPCPVKCECAYVRKILQTIRNWPKESHKSGKTLSGFS